MGRNHLVTTMWVGGTEPETSAAEQIEELYGSIEAGAFWAAVVFPAGYLPFLVDGIGSSPRALAFAGLVATHFLLLTVGHAHRQ